MNLPQDRNIGRLRQEIRELLRPELSEIDALVRNILNPGSTPPLKKFPPLEPLKLPNEFGWRENLEYPKPK